MSAWRAAGARRGAITGRMGHTPLMNRILLLIQHWIADGFAAWLESRRGPVTRLLGGVLAENVRLRDRIRLPRNLSNRPRDHPGGCQTRLSHYRG